MKYPIESVSLNSSGPAQRLTAGAVASTGKDGSDMRDSSGVAARIARLEDERDAALAAYGRIAPLLEAAAKRYLHDTPDGLLIAPHDGWQYALARAAELVEGMDVGAALERAWTRRGAA